MKKLSFLAMAAVALLFGACASDNVDAEKDQDPFKGRDGGFIKVGINMPVQPQVSTRAWEEGAAGTLEDGLDDEYKVKDCILLLFEGATEADAVLKQVEDVGTFNTKLTDDPNQVTTYVTKTVQLLNAPASNLYAMAVINGTGYIEMASNTTVRINGSATAEGSFKLSKLQNEIILRSAKKFIDDEGYIFMTNAVLSLEKGGTVDPTATPALHTLAEVDASRIYETEAEATAAAAPSADIYVERAVAKVTIDGSATDYLAVTALHDYDKTTTTAATLTGWAIDNYNSKSYLVKNATPFATWNLKSYSAAAGVDKYRFIGANPVDGGHTEKVANTGYRTYWAIDPNYDVAWASGMFITAAATEYSNLIGETHPQYCFENTFDVAHQIHAQTTRVVLKVALNGGNDFYTVGADKKTLYLLDDVKKKFVTALMGNSTFKTWYNNADPSKGGSATLTYDKITLTLATKTYGVVEVSEVKIDKSVLAGGVDITFDNTSTVEGSDLSGVIATVNAVVGKVTKYTDGATYYQIRIKHFGDDLTPWNADEYKAGYEPAEGNIAAIYPDADDARQAANYLGRYGMVRNNWYDLKIGAIVKIGSATVPDVNRDPTTPPTDPNDPEKPDHPDDELEDAFIKARINILSWAKRPQNWNLK